jgi:hypothetical protein
MGLPDFHSVETGYREIVRDYSAHNVITIAEEEMYSYDGFGVVISMFARMGAATTHLHLSDTYYLYIDGIQVFSIILSELLNMAIRNNTQIIYPIKYRGVHEFDFMLQSGLKFNNNITMKMKKTNVGAIYGSFTGCYGLY